ncbi:MAG: hypothetical protein HAW67_06520 [Endozoicomonadaceae bacterium]|nr:hypothetical protein [Endozoicomonadaceae bacterium]
MSTPIVSKVAMSYAVLSEVSNSEQKKIDKALSQICMIDHITCTSVPYSYIKYQIIKVPNWLDFSKHFYMHHEAITYNQGDQFEIQLSSHVINDEFALRIFLYHEIQHVLHSDFALYDTGIALDDPQQCQDHNKIKLKTSRFANKWNELLKSADRKSQNNLLALAKLPGNTPKKCFSS